MENKDYFKYICNLLKPYGKKIICLSILMLLTAVGNMAIPLLQQKIIDVGILEKEIYVLIQLVIVTILLYLIIAFFSYIQNRIQVEINCDFQKSLNLKSMEHLFRIKKDILDKEGVMKLAKNMEDCVDTLTQVTGNSVLQMLIELFKLIGIITALLLINWKLAIYSLLFLPVRFFITAVIGKYKQKCSKGNIEEHQKLHKWEEDVYSTIPEIKLYNLYENKNKEYNQSLSAIMQILKRSNLLSVKDLYLGDGLAQIIFNFLYLVSGIMIWEGSLTLGGLLIISSYFSYVLEPVSLFSAIGLTFSYIKPAIKQFDEYMKLPEEGESGGKKPNSSIESITVEDLTHFYDNNKVLDNLDIQFKKGKSYALVGENGSGKTTLIDLMLRFKEIQKGSIKLDNIYIKDYDICYYRERFGVVTQQANLFNATVKENITLFGRYQVVSEIINQRLFEFIKYLPNGIDSDVGSKAVQLSGGEKQKIALARALMKKPDILILDEPTSNYDMDSKYDFYELISNLNCTIIIISHDREMIKNVDSIVLLENGQAHQFEELNELTDYKPDIFR